MRRTIGGRFATVVVCALAGFMITVSALASAGGDLRPNRSTDLVELVQGESERAKELSAQLGRLRQRVDALSAKSSSTSRPDLRADLDKASQEASLTAVAGPAIRVTLTDAPLEVKPPGVAPDLLVVHQQDIQSVVNALWAGGAEAMTIQGVRVVSTTGIKCVGNSVVLKGVPYAPPYVITAIGNPDALADALENSSQVQIYRQYARAYLLGYQEVRLGEVTMPGYEGSTSLKYAGPAR